MTKRHYGLDLFRFVGAFMVLAGHLTLLLTFTPVTGVFQYFTTPLFWYGILLIPVPVFFMISGYFSLVRPNREDELVRTRKSFFNILPKYVFWIVVFVLVNIAINGGSITGNIGRDLLTALFNPIDFSIALMGVITAPIFAGDIASQSAFIVQTAPLWYLYTFMGFILIAPLLKAFMSSADIKVVRFVMIMLFVGVVVMPNFNSIATAAGEGSFLASVFGSSTFFDIDRFGSLYIFYYMLGAWLHREEGYKKLVERIPIVVLALLLVPAMILAMSAAIYQGSLSYDAILLVPAAVLFFVFFNKLDEKLTDEKGLGALVKKHSTKTLGIYITHVLVIGIMHTVIGFNNVNAFLTGFTGIVACLVYFVLAVAIFLVTFLLVSLLQKIPFIKRFV